MERAVAGAEDANKKLKTDLDSVKSDIKSTKSASDKQNKNVEDLTSKIFDCLHEIESLKDTIDKVNKKVDRRPAAEEIDKKSELTNKLYNELASKIDDVDDTLKKDIKKTKADLDKANIQIKSLSGSVDEKLSTFSRDLNAVKDQGANM